MMDSEERVWLEQLWRAMYKKSPLIVQVDQKNQYYNVRDNTLMFVWSDDLPQYGGKYILTGLSALIHPENQGDFEYWMKTGGKRVVLRDYLNMPIQLDRTMGATGVTEIQISDPAC